MSCPLYKSMKSNGTSFYAFPGASEDVASSRNNPNINFYFSHYALLNFPAQNLIAGTANNPIYFDFDSSFYKLTNVGQQATSFKDQLVESLRNYVANHEVTIRESRLNNTEFFYDSTELPTTSEKIFFKWCRKLNLMEFEQAIDGDEYFGNLIEFERNSLTDDAYFPEILWKEREVIDYNIKAIRQSTVSSYPTKVMIEYQTTTTNYKVGDIITIVGLTGSSYISNNDKQFTILSIVAPYSTYNQQVVLDIAFGLTESGTGYTRLVYNKLVQYIGDINGVNNVQEANRSYQEVFAHVPAHTGQTPDILFRTRVDRNYKPNMFYPILPSQYQPEILGAELFNSPIVSTPQNYPGNFYGQFDSQFEYTYRSSDGDSLRRSGDYFGVSGDINTPVVNTSNLDGIGLDFNSEHYVKMNILNQETPTFEQFNGLMINNEPPKDFEFNAILWYYTLEDNEGNTSTNLYGISFLDNPDNNPVEAETGIRIAPMKKLVATEEQDGTAYQFSLNLNYHIVNDLPLETFNPAAINSLFSFSLFNDAMTRLAQTNDAFNATIIEQNILKTELANLKQLVYTQADFANMTTKITYLESLLRSLQTLQVVDSETISVETVTSNIGFPTLRLNNIETGYTSVISYSTADLYNSQGIIPTRVIIPTNKNFLVKVTNNDLKIQSFANNDRLTIYFDSDLSFKQSVDIIVDSDEFATQNKQLEIYINYSSTSQIPVLTQVIPPLDFPIYWNTDTQAPNRPITFYNKEKFEIEPNLSGTIQISSSSLLTLQPLNMTSTILANTIKKGDTFRLQNLLIGTSSLFDFSGQYQVDSISGSNIVFNLSTNQVVTSWVSSNLTSQSFVLNSIISSKPLIVYNTGHRIRITRVTEPQSDSFESRYLVQKF